MVLWGEEVYADDEAVIAQARTLFHRDLMSSGLLTVNERGIASNADSSQSSSIAYAYGIIQQLAEEIAGERMVSQTSGAKFEELCAQYLRATFLELAHLRPGSWEVRHVKGRARGTRMPLAEFAQYAHLGRLLEATKGSPELLSILGNAYAIAPDVIVARRPVADSVINSDAALVDGHVSRQATLRAANGRLDYLHAVVSCKWTLRSDRAQNARSEALNLIRNRNGPLPHIVLVTAEPTPSRISSLALGTGDLDCVYHFALPELVSTVNERNFRDDADLLRAMVEGGRLKDISDLPLDLAL